MAFSRFSFPAIAAWLKGRPASPVGEPSAAAPEPVAAPTNAAPEPVIAAPEPPPVPANEAQLVAYAEKAKAQGVDELVLYLTFDCDTDEDAKAALELDPWLRKRGIRAAYAVPGTQLERAAQAYRAVKSGGATFLNHGAKPHAEWQGDRYVPITFYDQWTPEEVAEDIRRAHAIICDVLGEPPAGFRAPHFGSYQKPEQLAVAYGVARELGYSYCSTTMPSVGLDLGPLVQRDGLVEIPLFGSYLAPTTILDSWTYLEDRKNYRLGRQYFDLFRDTLDFMQNRRLPGVLAYYADPAHVIGQQPFLDAMELVAARGIRSVTAEELIGRARQLAGGQSQHH